MCIPPPGFCNALYLFSLPDAKKIKFRWRKIQVYSTTWILQCALSFQFARSTFSLVPGHLPSLSSSLTRCQPKPRSPLRPNWLAISPFLHISCSIPFCRMLFKLSSLKCRSLFPATCVITANVNRSKNCQCQLIRTTILEKSSRGWKKVSILIFLWIC